MQRQSSSSHSVSSFNHGSTANNLGLVQHNVGFLTASGHGDQSTSIGWIGQSSSIGSSHNQVTPEELNSVRGWSPSPDPNIGTSQRLGEMRSEPNSDCLSTGLVTIGPSTSRTATSDAVHHKLDLNVAYEDNHGNIRQEIGADYVNQTSSLERNSDVFERNTRRRINPTNEQNFSPSGMSSSVHVGTTSQHLQPPYTNWITSPSSSRSSSVSPVIPASGSNTLWQEENLQYIPRGTFVQRMQVPGTQRGAPGENLSTSRAFPRDYNSRVGITGVQPSAAPRLPQHNVTGGFQNGFTSGIHLSSTPGFPPRNMADEYEQRVSEIANHSMMRLAGFGSGGQIGYILPTSNTSVTRNAGALQALPNQTPRPSRILMMRAVGPNAVLPSILPPLQPVLAAQWRARLDGMIVHGPVFYEDLDYGLDVHEDMRLDVDNMSYEELLALEEHIGNVSTGLSEEVILGAMTRRRYQSMKLGPPLEEEPCCICQDDYVDGEELGKLECGHDFHFNCIKQWLIQKNSCPVCKTTALAI